MSKTCRPARLVRLAFVVACAIAVAACGETDPGSLGPVGVDGSLSPEGQRQAYVDGVAGALGQLGSATQNAGFAKAVDTGNKRSLQAASLAWRQGGEQLKSLNPPADAVAGHRALVKSVEGLDAWNQRIVRAAPNKALTKKVAKQASASAASKQFEQAVCQLVSAGFEVVDPDACGTALDGASAPAG